MTWRPKATHVLVDGPFANANAYSDWDEFPEWVVCACDDDGDPVGKVYRPRSFEGACKLGEKMANDRRLELVNEASPAW